MMRVFQSLLAAFLCFVCLSGCVTEENRETLGQAVGNDAQTDSTLYSFNDFRDYYNWFYPTDGERQRQESITKYSLFLEQIDNGRIDLYFPYYDDRVMYMSDFPTVMANLTFHGWEGEIVSTVPILYYESDQGVSSGPVTQISITYPGLDFSADILNGRAGKPIYDFCRTVCWATPLHLDWPKERTEKKLTLADKTVYSLWMTPQKDGNYNYACIQFFYRDDVFVTVEGNADVLTEDFFSHFRLAPLDERNKLLLGIIESEA